MRPSEPPHQHLRLVTLRRLHFQELAGPEAEALLAEVAACPHCAARLGSLRGEAQAFLQSAHVGHESAAILARLDAPAPARRRWWARPWVPALAAAVALLAVLTALPTAPTVSTTRVKGGGPGLVMFVKDAQGVRRGEDGVHLSPGDQVQFRYEAGGHRHLFLVSIDAAGAVSPLYPETATESIPVEPEGTHVLEGSVILDDAVGPERFVAVFSARPIPFAELAGAAARGLADGGGVTALSTLPLARDDVRQASVLIVKE